MQSSTIQQLQGTQPRSPEARLQRATEVANKFEALFVQQMVQSFRKTSLDGEDGGLFGSGPGSDTYGQWFDNHMATHMTSSRGLGVAKTVLQDMVRWGQLQSEQISSARRVDHVA